MVGIALQGRPRREAAAPHMHYSSTSSRRSRSRTDSTGPTSSWQWRTALALQHIGHRWRHTTHEQGTFHSNVALAVCLPTCGGGETWKNGCTHVWRHGKTIDEFQLAPLVADRRLSSPHGPSREGEMERGRRQEISMRGTFDDTIAVCPVTSMTVGPQGPLPCHLLGASTAAPWEVAPARLQWIRPAGNSGEGFRTTVARTPPAARPETSVAEGCSLEKTCHRHPGSLAPQAWVTSLRLARKRRV